MNANILNNLCGENSRFEIFFSYLISFGLLVQVLGLLVISDGSTYSTNTSIFLMIPSLLAIIFFKEPAKDFFRLLSSKLLLLFLFYILAYAMIDAQSLSDTKKWLKIWADSKAECNTVNESTLGHYHSAPALLA